MNHGIVLLVVLATFRVLDNHGCNGQVSIPISPLLPPPPPCPPPPPPPSILELAPVAPPSKPPPRPLVAHDGSDPSNCCFDPYHCCDHDDDSNSGIDIWLVALVAAILLLLILALLFFLFNFWGFRKFVRATAVTLQNIVHAINQNLVTAINGVAVAIGTNLGANGPINKNLTAIDGKLGAIDGKLAAIPGPLLEISKRLENICPNCNVHLTVLPCKCDHSTYNPCHCDGSSPCRCDCSP